MSISENTTALKKCLWLSVILLGISIIFNYTEVPATPMLPFLIIFFFSITVIVHHFLVKLSKDRPAKFINGFMLTTTLKLFLYAIILFVYAYIDRSGAVSFIITFFLLYLIYTIFEIVQILPILRKNNDSK